MAPRSKKIRAPSDYFLWAPQEQGVQSENPRFSSERHSRRGARRKVAALLVYIIDFIFHTNRI